jgi:hypothetical protein
MKLPRWLMIGMWTSSILAVLAAAGWWWVMWPERTAREFADLMAAQNWEKVRDLIRRSGEGPSTSTWPITAWRSGRKSVQVARARSPLDLILGRQDFKLDGSNVEFAVERGKVVWPRDVAWYWEYGLDVHPEPFRVTGGILFFRLGPSHPVPVLEPKREFTLIYNENSHSRYGGVFTVRGDEIISDEDF